MNPNIIIIGFKQSLKTEVAKAYARICKREFFDMSSQIANSNLRKKNKFIAQKYMVRKFAKFQNKVLTLSSGILSNQESQEKLKKNIFVYLKKESLASDDEKLDKIYQDHAKITITVPELYDENYKATAKLLARQINEGLERY